jgi:hypothetical protein
LRINVRTPINGIDIYDLLGQIFIFRATRISNTDFISK